MCCCSYYVLLTFYFCPIDKLSDMADFCFLVQYWSRTLALCREASYRTNSSKQEKSISSSHCATLCKLQPPGNDRFQYLQGLAAMFGVSWRLSNILWQGVCAALWICLIVSTATHAHTVPLQNNIQYVPPSEEYLWTYVLAYFQEELILLVDNHKVYVTWVTYLSFTQFL